MIFFSIENWSYTIFYETTNVLKKTIVYQIANKYRHLSSLLDIIFWYNSLKCMKIAWISVRPAIRVLFSSGVFILCMPSLFSYTFPPFTPQQSNMLLRKYLTESYDVSVLSQLRAYSHCIPHTHRNKYCDRRMRMIQTFPVNDVYLSPKNYIGLNIATVRLFWKLKHCTHISVHFATLTTIVQNDNPVFLGCYCELRNKHSIHNATNEWTPLTSWGYEWIVELEMSGLRSV